MKKGLLLAALATATILGSMTVSANSGMGFYADKDASLDWKDTMVYCVDNVDFKNYINDDDPVVNTYEPGTIFKLDNELLRNGKAVGWGETAEMKRVKEGDGESMGQVFFKLDNIRPYGGKENIRVDISDDMKEATIHIPDVDGAKFTYVASKPDVLQPVGDEEKDGELIVHMKVMQNDSEKGEDIDSTVEFKGYVDGKLVDNYRVNFYGGKDFISFTTVVIPPVDFSQISDQIDHYAEEYKADGSVVKVAYLKDGRCFDMDGFRVFSISDKESQMHDGTVINKEKPAK